MHKKILLVSGLLTAAAGYAQKILNSPQQPGTVLDPVSISLQPGFSFSSSSGEFIARIGTGTTAPPASTGSGYTPIAVNYGSTFNSTENYIYTREYLVPKTSEDASAQQIQGIQFFDGLGRPKQTVSIKSTSSGKDLATKIPYDGFGRQADSFLPVPLASKSGGIHPDSDISSALASVYKDTRPFAHKELENSPLDRLLRQVHPGSDWQSNPIAFDYLANGKNEVKKYTTSTSWNAGATSSALSQSAYYDAGQLYKNKVSDEDKNVSYEFKNGQGQTLLVRKELSPAAFADTYYVYNEYDQLAFVIPPLAAAKPALSPTDLEELCYQYRYDGRNRLVEKKLPGKGWEYMVYDKQDRLAATQDAVMKSNGEWLFTKYDQFGRVAYTGITKSALSREGYQRDVASKVSNSEKRDASGFGNSGNTIYYTNADAYPNVSSADKVLSVNYYDAYPGGTPPAPGSITGQALLSATPAAMTVNGFSSIRSTRGLPVSVQVKNIENDGWTRSYTWYDDKGRAVKTRTDNHLGGFTTSESLLTFSGKPLKTITRHRRLPSDADRVIAEQFVYDHQERLVQHKHQVDGQKEVMLAENLYNDLGQLGKKNIGGGIQAVDYGYNIRGWMTQINDPSALGSDLFGYKIKYQNPDYRDLGPARYNGNISEVDWKTSTDGTLRRYDYRYDALNRMYHAIYSKPSSTVPQTNAYNEWLEYDINGNIRRLDRYGGLDANQAMQIDRLHYTYAGNRLDKVADLSSNASGYPALAAHNAIGYDANGNMTSQMDKKISAIAYNFLNLPRQVTQAGVDTRYAYRADGIKVEKRYGAKQVDYLDGFQYENGVLQFVPTSEGYYDFVKKSYIYNYLDHLGNVRLSYTKNSAGLLEIVEESSYYPFGLKHEGYNSASSSSPSYRYKYNGKELQETGMYDYGARMYMPDAVIWGHVDPLAEKFPSWSPYNYTFNNPINFIDPDGREGKGWGLKDGQWHFVKDMQKDDEAYKKGGFTDFRGDGSTVPNVTITNSTATNTGHTYLGFSASDVKYVDAPQATISQWDGDRGVLGNWANSESFLGKLSYGAINNFYLAAQVVDFDMIGNDWTDPTGGRAYTNLDGTPQYDSGERAMAFTSTFNPVSPKFLPASSLRVSQEVLTPLTASQFSKLFKGTSAARATPAVRGYLNRGINTVLNKINNVNTLKTGIVAPLKPLKKEEQ